jgi:1-acylglycerol-3-phosphate O-acyltransferase
MEKFTKFRDAGTGIAPFLPIAPSSRAPLVIPFELTLCVMRIPLIFLVFAFEVVFVEGLGEVCLRGVLPRVLGWMKWVFFRTILLLCGIWYIEEQVEKTFVSFYGCGLMDRGDAAIIYARSGDLIVSNHTSPLDLIYLSAKYGSVGFSS